MDVLQKQHTGDFQVFSTPLLDAAQYTYAETNGSNLSAILSHPLIDGLRSTSNDIMETYYKFGIEAARALFIILLKQSFEAENQYTDPRHIGMIADFMFNMGQPLPSNFHGMSAQNANALQMLSFEQPAPTIIKACAHGSEPKIEPPSACIIMGKQAYVGTGIVDCFVCGHGEGDSTADPGPSKAARQWRRSDGPAGQGERGWRDTATASQAIDCHPPSRARRGRGRGRRGRSGRPPRNQPRRRPRRSRRSPPVHRISRCPCPPRTSPASYRS